MHNDIETMDDDEPGVEIENNETMEQNDESKWILIVLSI